MSFRQLLEVYGFTTGPVVGSGPQVYTNDLGHTIAVSLQYMALPRWYHTVKGSRIMQGQTVDDLTKYLARNRAVQWAS